MPEGLPSGVSDTAPCAKRDLNPHEPKPTDPSSQRVYHSAICAYRADSVVNVVRALLTVLSRCICSPFVARARRVRSRLYASCFAMRC